MQVNVPLDFTTVHGNYTSKAGPQKLDGDRALAIRERYAFIDGDYQWVQDQQIFLSAILNAVLSTSTLTNPLKVTDLVSKISPYVSVDAGLDSGPIAALALASLVSAGPMPSFILPPLGTGTSADGQSIVNRDGSVIVAIGQALGNDTLGA